MFGELNEFGHISAFARERGRWRVVFFSNMKNANSEKKVSSQKPDIGQLVRSLAVITNEKNIEICTWRSLNPRGVLPTTPVLEGSTPLSHKVKG